MKVKCKKIMSAVVVSAIVAAQALMPVAAESGSITSNLTTKTPIIRVQVPTQMAIAVDAFDTAKAGSQIYSEEFDMQNKSEIPVKVAVTSKLKYASDDVELATAKKDASALGAEEAWVATAAKTAANKYHDTKTIAQLEGTESNITTFAKTATEGEAETKQEFYLNGGGAVYAMLQKETASTHISDDAKELGGYTELYELTLATPADDAALQALVDAGDVYHVATPANKAALMKIAKGTPGVTKGTDTYYTVSTTKVLANTLTTEDAKIYVYANSSATDKDVAGFRYIGVLSDSKNGGWSNTDLTQIIISYDITGLTSAAYTEIAKADGSGLTYGYKAPEEASSPIKISATGLMTIEGFDDADFDSATLMIDGDSHTYVIDPDSGTWDTSKTPVEYQWNQEFTSLLKGKTVTIKINLVDNKPAIEATFVVPQN